jgi:hypothetical protein
VAGLHEGYLPAFTVLYDVVDQIFDLRSAVRGPRLDAGLTPV